MQLAVFIDFDNIEIGVKTTLNNELDICWCWTRSRSARRRLEERIR